MKKIFILTLSFMLCFSCNTISTKVDKATQIEEDKLSQYLNKTESDLKIEFGIPDVIKKKNGNKILIYYESKFKIKCERRFEINQMRKVIGFSSKNCF
tara:strand:- start:2932 stop:3225 length:294 start_codon:yes stop_codon:yes gene_type:complete